MLVTISIVKKGEDICTLLSTEKNGTSIKESMLKEGEGKQKKNLYLHNKDLYIEIIVSKARGKLTRAAEKMLILLAGNVVRKMFYLNEDDRLDCLQSAYLDLFKNWHNFNELKGNDAFSYYTEIVKRNLS